jgi:hypothetical protein
VPCILTNDKTISNIRPFLKIDAYRKFRLFLYCPASALKICGWRPRSKSCCRSHRLHSRHLISSQRCCCRHCQRRFHHPCRHHHAASDTITTTTTCTPVTKMAVAATPAALGIYTSYLTLSHQLRLLLQRGCGCPKLGFRHLNQFCRAVVNVPRRSVLRNYFRIRVAICAIICFFIACARCRFILFRQCYTAGHY